MKTKYHFFLTSLFLFYCSQNLSGNFFAHKKLKKEFVAITQDTILETRDSIIVYKKGNEKFFKKIGNEKSYGSFIQIELDKKENIIYVKDKNTTKLYNFNCEIVLEDAKFYNNYKREFLLADDIYLKEISVPNYLGKKLTFANGENNNTFGEYVRIDISEDRTDLQCCVSTSHGRGWEECHGPKFSIIEILRALKKDYLIKEKDENLFYVEHNGKVALMNREGKIISKFYDFNSITFEFFEKKGGISENVLLDNNGKEIYRTIYRVEYYDNNFQLLYDKTTHKYYVDFFGKKIKINDKIGKPISVINRSYNSNLYLLKNSENGNMFFINASGKIFNNKKNITNYYNHRAFLIENEDLYIVDENFKKIEKIEGKYRKVEEIDEQGFAVIEEKNTTFQNAYIDITTMKIYRW